MIGIKYHSQPNFRSPVMLAAWPGMGAVASQSVDYIRRKLEVELFAEIETGEVVEPNTVLVAQGIAYFPRLPKVFFFYSRKFDLLFCEAEDQFPSPLTSPIVERLFHIAKEARVSKIFSSAAFVQHRHHLEESQVYVVSNSARLLESLAVEHKLKVLPQGQISGLNGTILGFAARKNIDAACFLATIPIYGINFPNPRASKAIVEVWQTLLGLSVDLSDYDNAVREADRSLEAIEEQLKNMVITTDVTESEEEIEKSSEESDTIPPYVIQRIEELFAKAKEDRTIAHKLKGELDRWKLFEEYEDRFLDLFRDSH